MNSQTETVTVSAQVNSSNSGAGNNTGGSSGGGGGGGGGSSNVVSTIVNFSGLAYPSSKVTILKNGALAATTIADSTARFSVSISDLSTDTYTFSVFGQDKNGVKSISFSFPVFVTSGTTVNIGGIFLSPTISIDKSEVRRGDTLQVFGQTTPNTTVDVIFHSSAEISRQVLTDKTGLYTYSMDTSPLEYGGHTVKSKTVVDTQVNALSLTLPFTVSLISKKIEKINTCGTLRGDLNCDGHVNLVDFSIMAYWFNKKITPPTKIDLSGDGKITLTDFSIIAFNWTG